MENCKERGKHFIGLSNDFYQTFDVYTDDKKVNWHNYDYFNFCPLCGEKLEVEDENT